MMNMYSIKLNLLDSIVILNSIINQCPLVVDLSRRRYMRTFLVQVSPRTQKVGVVAKRARTDAWILGTRPPK